MGASLGGGAHRHRPGQMRPMAEINVTPLVDVMLVLLIVFMIAAPLLTVGVAVDLPETSAEPIVDQGEPLTVTIGGDGTIYVQDTVVVLDNLVPQLEAISSAGYDQRIYIRGDRARSYGEVMQVMGRINAAGFRRNRPGLRSGTKLTARRRAGSASAAATKPPIGPPGVRYASCAHHIASASRPDGRVVSGDAVGGFVRAPGRDRPVFALQIRLRFRI